MYTSHYGRWLSPDPLAGDISNPQSLNRYAYVLNNPVNLVDPTGLDSKCTVLADGTVSCPPTTITVNGTASPDLFLILLFGSPSANLNFLYNFINQGRGVSK